MKECSKCGIEKPLQEFTKDRTKPDGYYSSCRECKKSQYQSWAKNKTDEDRQRLAASVRAYFARHPEKRAQMRQAWSEQNRERINARNRQKYHGGERERFLGYAHRRRARLRGAPGSYAPADIDRLFFMQRGRCAICRKALNKSFHRDHIVPITRGGANDAENIQLLCILCNSRKSDKDPVEYMQSIGRLL